MTVLYIVGFPSLYGGAGAELYHQVRVWETLGVALHFIPTQKNVRKAALHGEMTERGHVIHDAYDWTAIPEDAPVISFCNEDFLAALPEIRRRTRRTVFVNCMTWLFGKEKEAMSRGDIALFLYQNDKVRQSMVPRLQALYEYGPYGSSVKMEGNAVEVNPFRFSSEFFDEETGLVQYNFRYYNPKEGRWASREPMTEKETYLLYGYVNNIPTLYSDELGLAHTITTNKDNCSINVSLNIVIYPKRGDSIHNIEMQTAAQQIKQSIESSWNGYKKGCCIVNVTADVSIQSRKSRRLYRFFNRDENNIEITSDPSHRSYVNVVGGRYGSWSSQAAPWVYAHEAGHLMGLPDDYQDRIDSDGVTTSVPNEGHEGHMMGEYGGSVNQHEIDDILQKIKCPCDENQ